jgi:lysozyme family protein
MLNICKYNDFILESNFNKIIDEIFLLVESEGKWIDNKTLVWDFNKSSKKNILDRLKIFLSELPKEKIKEYFFKLLEKLKSSPKKIRKGLIISYSSVFLSMLPISYILDDRNSENFKEEFEIILSEFSEKEIDKESSFDEAQEIVKLAEGDYSSDKKDIGNYVKTKNGRIFVGTKYGISAPVLMEYLKRIPSKDDMIGLSYKDALVIYKNKYWDKQNLNKFTNQSISNIIYDGCVNQGIGAMKNILRKVYNSNNINIDDSDNPFDIRFIDEINKIEAYKIFNDIKGEREIKYKSAYTYNKHGKGWLNRLNSIEFKK